MVAGLMRMAPVAIMLLGTGTLAGIIANSNPRCPDSWPHRFGIAVTAAGARVSAMMSMATTLQLYGRAVASARFLSTLLELGVSATAEPLRRSIRAPRWHGPSAARQLFPRDGRRRQYLKFMNV